MADKFCVQGDSKEKRKGRRKKIQEEGLLGSTHDFLLTKMMEDLEMLKQAMDYLKNKQEKLKEVTKSSGSKQDIKMQ